MSTQASITAATASVPRREASSTAWFWWKESHQLAPLFTLLIVVASLIVIASSLMTSMFPWMSSGMLSEAAVLIFPGLFATGAGPLLVGQERAQHTMNWLVLLPISSKRLITTKFLVAFCGLVVMWLFYLTLLGLVAPSSPAWRWTLGQSTAFTSIPFSGAIGFPLFITHSVFVLVVGFFVAWRLANQFYSLMALVLLAFAPFIATSFIAELFDRPPSPGRLEWINFWFVVAGIGILMPLAYRAAIKTLSPAAAPPLKSLPPYDTVSPATPISDAIPPRFGTRLAPIVWQSYHSARGIFAVLVGMLVVSWLATIGLASIEHVRGVFAGTLPLLLIAAPLAICWIAVAVFKHDGSTERIRFLADRGVSHRVAYFGLHAVPFGIVTGSLLVYGLWNLTIPHRGSASDFADDLPTLVPMALFAFAIYSVSQWVSQLMRTMMLAVILAPVGSLIICSWLTFSFVALGFPIWGVITCLTFPLLATAWMMRRYADGTDRPMCFVVAGLVVASLIALPSGFAAWQVSRIPKIDETLRRELLSEARRLRANRPPARPISMPGVNNALLGASTFLPDPIDELDQLNQRYTGNAADAIETLTASGGSPVTLDHWSYARWHGAFLLHRRKWMEDPDQWTSFAPWLEASGRLLPALRRSTLLPDQKVADRLEVLLLDTLAMPQLKPQRDEPAVTIAARAIGTPQSRAAARRRAALVTWSYLQDEDDDQQFRNVGYLAIEQSNSVPPGLSGWMHPRIMDAFLLALLNGIEAAQQRPSDQDWRRVLHALHQPGGVFETSRYGDAIRLLPPMETMTVSVNTGFGQLWGLDWEQVDPQTLLDDPK